MTASAAIPVMLALTVGISALADTITTTDNVSYNGSVKNMANGELTLQAGFKDSVNPLTFKQTQLDSIEFNDETFNAGSPPKSLGARPGKNTPSPTAARPDDVVVFRGGERKPCKLLSIDTKTVHCAGVDWDRDTITRVLIHR
jgi:hypothetical protein